MADGLARQVGAARIGKAANRVPLMASFGKQMADQIRALNPKGLPAATGMSWYTPRSYTKCMAVFDDADQLDATFDQWYPKALAIEQDLQRSGQRVIRVLIDPVQFPKWCAENGFAKADKHARLMYGNQKVAEVLLAEQKARMQGRIAKLMSGGRSLN